MKVKGEGRYAWCIYRKFLFSPWLQGNPKPELDFCPVVATMPSRRAWQPTPVFSPGDSPWTEEPGGLQSMGS